MYCGTTNLVEPSGTCWAGYYCPESSTSPTQVDCPMGAYCPNASASFTLCPKGVYPHHTKNVDSYRNCLFFNKVMLLNRFLEVKPFMLILFSHLSGKMSLINMHLNFTFAES